MSTPFEELKILFPVWEIENKAAHSVVLDLAGGDSVQFTPGSRRKIKSEMLHQMPSPASFIFHVPNTANMVDVGLIKRNVVTKPASSKPTTSIFRPVDSE